MTANTTLTRWVVDTGRTTAGFSVRNLGVKTVRGTVPVLSAWVDVDLDARPVAVHAELDLAAVDTANTRRDGDLAKPRLLDTATFPTMRFDGGPGVLSDKGVWTVPGRLATHGREVELDLVVRRDALAFKATTSFDRGRAGRKGTAVHDRPTHRGDDRRVNSSGPLRGVTGPTAHSHQPVAQPAATAVAPSGPQRLAPLRDDRSMLVHRAKARRESVTGEPQLTAEIRAGTRDQRHTTQATPR